MGFPEFHVPTVRRILCFGDPLHGDDGFGHAVYQRLAALPLPHDLCLIDAGTPGLSALPLFQGCAEVIIIDALAPSGSPGRLSQPLPEAIAAEAFLPAHGVGVGYLLRALTALPEQSPQIRIIAAEASGVTPFRSGLSQPVSRAVDEAVALLRPYFEPNGHG
jgi:hydrogenase maturation protease